jgi:molybdate transport system substrate-binding protein
MMPLERRGLVMRRLLLVLSLLLAPLARAEEITVFAAASLTDALGEIGKAYEAEGKGRIVASFASSSDLARQIEHGAPADLFISADQQWADYLDQRGLIEKGSRFDLLSNELVLVAPANSEVKMAIATDFPLAAALGDGRLAVGDPDHVPAGIYARQALETLGVWSSVQDRLARAGSVRAALLFVERGDCPLGIVYRSDALSDAKVRVVGTFPADSHPPVIYPAARVAGHVSPAAIAFLRYLTTPQAAAIFKKYGFNIASQG